MEKVETSERILNVVFEALFIRTVLYAVPESDVLSLAESYCDGLPYWTYDGKQYALQSDGPIRIYTFGKGGSVATMENYEEIKARLEAHDKGYIFRKDFAERAGDNVSHEYFLGAFGERMYGHVLADWKSVHKVHMHPKEPSQIVSLELQNNKIDMSETPLVFISYSWDSEPHKNWVRALADQLLKHGIDVILDQYDLEPGKSIPHFAEQSIKRADFTVVVFTPNYKMKAERRAGGVGYEYSIMNAQLYANQMGNVKILPLLRQGSMAESMPDFMQQYLHINFSNDQDFEYSFNELIRKIYRVPALSKPKLGKKPDFLTNEKAADKIVEVEPIAKIRTKVTGPINPAILARIRENEVYVFDLANGSKMNAGSIRIEDGYLIHYTGKGLRELWKPTMTEEELEKAKVLREQSEEYLEEHEYIKWTPLDQIVGINR